MAGYSARQSTFTSGDTITAAHSNDEFNQLLAAFHATTGHTHDGTAGDGGPVSTLRDADALNKILVDTTNNHLEFYVEVSSAAVEVTPSKILSSAAVAVISVPSKLRASMLAVPSTNKSLNSREEVPKSISLSVIGTIAPSCILNCCTAADDTST